MRLYLLCIAVGIAALVSIHSFSLNVSASIDNQSKALLGSDLSLQSRFPIDETWLKEIEALISPSCPERRLAAMADFQDNDTPPRLVQLRAIGSGYPYYGEIKNHQRL